MSGPERRPRPEKRLSGEVVVYFDEVADWTDEDWQHAKDAFRAGEYESQFVTCDFSEERVLIVSGGAGGGKTDELFVQQVGRAYRLPAEDPAEKLFVSGFIGEPVGKYEQPGPNRRRHKRNARKKAGK